MSDLIARRFEQHFISMLHKRVGDIDADVRSIITELTAATMAQHSCLDLSGRAEALLTKLLAQPFVGTGEEPVPIILSGKKLYLSRYYRYEKEIAAMVCERNVAVETASNLKARLDHHFGQETGNQQKLAALLATSRQLAIITGGPGTGKTSTVVKILAILLENDDSMNIKLAAPTGKAAMRLAESIRQTQISGASAHEQLRDPKVVTLHRLLGMRRDGRHWRHGPHNPISADVLVIDEASMIDLTMMHRLLDALPGATRLVLLGDPNQLPSVDTGNVLADLCTGEPVFSIKFASFAEPIIGPVPLGHGSHKLIDSICRLEKSYRFEPTSSIGILATSIHSGDAHLKSSEDGKVSVIPPSTLPESSSGAMLLEPWRDYIDLLERGETSATLLLTAFDRARVLCSRRGGFPGVDRVNTAIELELENRGLKSPENDFYLGRPVLITRNDYNLGLFNGDVGICIPLEDQVQDLVVFASAEGERVPVERALLASRLPTHETCFAMTVHKAQGSEFDHVTLLLAEPTDTEIDSLTTRELIYTAVTRAKQSITVYSSPERWRAALALSSVRVSGMTEFLGIGQSQLELL